MLLCEVTNYMVALPLMSTRTPHILDAFQKGYLAYFGPPTHIICDQDPAFTSSLMEAFVTQLNIKIVLVSPTVISTVFESKDKPTQMTKQSFTIIDFITYRKSIHFELICKDVHN